MTVSPDTHPELFAAIILGSTRSPGTVTLTGHDRDQDWDIKKAKGQTGASSTLNGSSPGDFQASFYLADIEQQLAWPAFQRLIESTTNGASPKALPIYHPDLAVNHYTEVCNGSVGGIVRDSRGGVTVLVKFQEHRPAKPKKAKTATGGSGGKTGGKDEYDPNADRKRQLDNLLHEASTI